MDSGHSNIPQGVVGVLLARMDSRRFPGKILSQISGLTVLELIVLRLRDAFHDTLPLVLATTNDSSDDILMGRAESIELPVFRGSKSDVLQRALEAVSYMNGTHLLRLNGDSPLVEPLLIKQGLEAIRSDGARVVTSKGVSNLPYGISAEICSVERLRRFHSLASRAEREHIFNAVYRLEPEHRIKRIGADFPKDSELRLTIDWPSDAEYLSRLIDTSGLNPVKMHYWELSCDSQKLVQQ